MSDQLPLTRELLDRLPLPQPPRHTDKNHRGTVLIAGGSATSPGAVLLSGEAAFRAGAGKVLLAVPQPVALSIAVRFPEAGVHGFASTPSGDPDMPRAARGMGDLLARADAALVGPGFTEATAAQEIALSLLEAAPTQPMVADALCTGGLWEAQQRLSRRRGHLVITPHAGEMARLRGVSAAEVCADSPRFARETAMHLRATVVLKGSMTVIAQPEGPMICHDADIPGLGISGSGDVLAGVLAGLLARGADALSAAVWSVWLHAQAGRRLSRRIGPLGFLSRELPAEIPGLLRDLG